MSATAAGSAASSVTNRAAKRARTSGPNAIRKQKRNWGGWIFTAPFAIVFVLVFITPLLYAAYLSLFQTRLIGGTVFVGLDNYVNLLQDPAFWEGFKRVLLLLLIQVPIMLGLSMIAALAIDSARLYMTGVFRIIIFLPYAIPGVVAILMWGFLYSNNFGLAASINEWIGHNVVLPFSPQWIMVSLGNIVTWQFVGYNMLIFYSALKTIPTDLYEAAEIDGARGWQVTRAIKLPALRGSIVIATVFSIIGSFQHFTEPSILQPLAQGTITSSFTPNLYAYTLAFQGRQFNYSATVAIVMGIITAIIAYVVQLRGTRKEDR